MSGTKSGAASISIVSNSLLIAAKLAAAAITGSIAIVTEAAHSSIDLVASVIALVSVRKSDEPPDPEHPYGHERFENFAAAIEGMLVIVGAGIIVYEATRRLVVGAEVEHLGVGIAVIAASAVVNTAVGGFLARRPDFEADDLQAGAPSGLPVWDHPRVSRFLQTLPHRDRTDGFFIARLRRS
jgi:cation diffusion facilitator family transporter